MAARRANQFIFLAAQGSSFTNLAGQLRWFQASGATFVEGTVNADKVADFQIQLTGLKTLTRGRTSSCEHVISASWTFMSAPGPTCDVQRRS